MTVFTALLSRFFRIDVSNSPHDFRHSHHYTNLASRCVRGVSFVCVYAKTLTRFFLTSCSVEYLHCLHIYCKQNACKSTVSEGSFWFAALRWDTSRSDDSSHTTRDIRWASWIFCMKSELNGAFFDYRIDTQSKIHTTLLDRVCVSGRIVQTESKIATEIL